MTKVSLHIFIHSLVNENNYFKKNHLLYCNTVDMKNMTILRVVVIFINTLKFCIYFSKNNLLNDKRKSTTIMHHFAHCG